MLRQTDASIWQREIFESNRFSLKELTAFTVELATLTASGLPLDAAFRIIAGPGAAPKTARLANGLLKDVLAGAQLSEAMARRPEIFPPDYRAILGAGEAGGITGRVLTQIADLLAQRLEMRAKITSALVYPIILVLMSLASVAVIVFFLLPTISPIFIDAGLPLPGILSTFADIQDNWLSVALALGVAAMACALLCRKARQNDRCHARRIDRLKSSLPVIGKLDTGTRGWRLRAGARHIARRKGSVDVGNANRAGAGDQPASECPLSACDWPGSGGHAPASGV